MCSAESAIFLSFHSIWMSFLFFCHVVVTLFAFCTCQCDFYTHNCHLQLLIYFSVFRHKKKTYFISPVHYITFQLLSQVFFTRLSAFFYSPHKRHPYIQYKKILFIFLPYRSPCRGIFFDSQRKTFRSSYCF